MPQIENDLDDNLEEDCKAELPEWLISENILYKRLNIINKFKKYIKAQPTFMAIDYISDYEMMCLINKDKKSNDDVLDYYEVELFDDLYNALFGVKGSKEVYEAVTYQILKKCYVY